MNKLVTEQLDLLFKNRTLVIATMHGKEKIIAPVLNKYLKVNCYLPNNFNTDVFGTFTGEIERSNDPVSTVRQKCYAAMELYQSDLAIASEGSFGPHPGIGFVPSNTEVIALIDKKNNIEVIAHELSVKTNFSGGYINDFNELNKKLTSLKFPTHALILRADPNSSKEVFKGIKTLKALRKYYNYLSERYGKVYYETDMRAMHNPTRRDVIRKAVQTLLNKLTSFCPECKSPGFSVNSYVSGLNCSSCGFPTASTLKHVLKCGKCNYHEEKIYPNGKHHEDPMYCNYCNP